MVDELGLLPGKEPGGGGTPPGWRRRVWLCSPTTGRPAPAGGRTGIPPPPRRCPGAGPAGPRPRTVPGRGRDQQAGAPAEQGLTLHGTHLPPPGDGELGGDLVQHPVSGDTGEPGLVGEQQPVGQHGVDQGLDVVRGNEGAARHGGPGPGGPEQGPGGPGLAPIRTMGWLRVAPTKATR